MYKILRFKIKQITHCSLITSIRLIELQSVYFIYNCSTTAVLGHGND